MDRRVFWWFCLLTALRSAGSADPEITINSNKTLTCNNGVFDHEPKSLLEEASSGKYSCVKTDLDAGCPEDENCTRQKILVKVLSSDSLIQLNTPALVTVLVSDIMVTALIGWAVYSICAHPRARSSYQGNKASDRVNLINNSTGDTYQPLNTRSDEYSTLHGARKPKNKHPISP